MTVGHRGWMVKYYIGFLGFSGYSISSAVRLVTMPILIEWSAQGTSLLCSIMVEREKLRDLMKKEAVRVMPLLVFLGFIPC